MLAKPRRLVKEKDFEKVFKQGRSYYSNLVGVKIIPGSSGLNRFGFIVSSKVSKKATERNRLKRQLRAITAEFDEQLDKGFDIAILALPGLLARDFSAIKEELKKVFIKLKLLEK